MFSLLISAFLHPRLGSQSCDLCAKRGRDFCPEASGLDLGGCPWYLYRRGFCPGGLSVLLVINCSRANCRRCNHTVLIFSIIVYVRAPLTEKRRGSSGRRLRGGQVWGGLCPLLREYFFFNFQVTQCRALCIFIANKLLVANNRTRGDFEWTPGSGRENRRPPSRGRVWARILFWIFK